MTDAISLATALADRYTLGRELGAGGMATVYLARDVRHGRDVAIKVLHPDLGAALGSERFLSEIHLTARLQHPHVLPLLDSGNAAGLLFYVMPLVTGETLRARLDRERQLPVADALAIAREVADALGYAHTLGVIHRDVKPENILLQNGHATVADFGIALAVQNAGGARMTQTGLSLGTPHYMSPEQATGERVIDARSDIYALGAVTYEMLVGEPPFTGPSVQAIIARVMTEEPRGLVVQRKAVPPAVEDAVFRALEKLPADRFATAAAFAAALDAGAGTSTRATRALATGRGARRALLAMGAVAVGASAMALWGWLRPQPSRDVVRYGIVIDSVPAVKDWAGELAISPDGTTIVRSGGPGDLLLVRARDQLAFAPLPGTEGAAAPFFSPDGTRVGFYAEGAIRAVPLAGGPAVVITETIDGAESTAWGQDGYLYRGLLVDGALVIARSPARADAPLEPVTRLDRQAGELTHLHPHLLPDGKTLLFQVAHRDGRRKIAVGDIATGTHEILFDGARAQYVDGFLLYTTADGKLWAVAFDPGTRKSSGAAVQVGDRIPNTQVGPVDFDVASDGTLVYSVEDAGARRELTWVTRDGRREPVDAGWKGDFASPTLSPDGTRIAVAMRVNGLSDIWTKPVAGGVASKLTVRHRNNVEPAWSADGRSVSYLAAGGGSTTGDVWRQPADGTGRAERIASADRPLAEQVAVPGTDALLVRTTTPTTGAGDILMVRPGIDSMPTPLVSGPSAQYSPVVSPDGRWLAYVSDESGRFEVYVVPFASPESAKWPVSAGGGTTPRWSHRGDELFFLDGRSNMVAARVAFEPSFAVQGTRVLFNGADFVQTAVSRRNFDVSLDDQRFLMVQRADGAKRGQVVVVEHWVDEMRRGLR